MTCRALPVLCPKCNESVPRYETRGDRYRAHTIVEDRRYYRCRCGHRFATTFESKRLPSGDIVTIERQFADYRPAKPRPK